MDRKRHIHLTDVELERLRELRRYILEHLHLPMTTPSMARQVLMHEVKMNAGFRQLFGKTAYAFLLESRMEAVVQLLRNTDLYLKEIAQRCGYTNSPAMIRAFKKHYGYTPDWVRRRKKSGTANF